MQQSPRNSALSAQETQISVVKHDLPFIQTQGVPLKAAITMAYRMNSPGVRGINDRYHHNAIPQNAWPVKTSRPIKIEQDIEDNNHGHDHDANIMMATCAPWKVAHGFQDQDLRRIQISQDSGLMCPCAQDTARPCPLAAKESEVQLGQTMVKEDIVPVKEAMSANRERNSKKPRLEQLHKAPAILSTLPSNMAPMAPPYDKTVLDENYPPAPPTSPLSTSGSEIVWVDDSEIVWEHVQLDADFSTPPGSPGIMITDTPSKALIQGWSTLMPPPPPPPQLVLTPPRSQCLAPLFDDEPVPVPFIFEPISELPTRGELMAEDVDFNTMLNLSTGDEICELITSGLDQMSPRSLSDLWGDTGDEHDIFWMDTAITQNDGNLAMQVFHDQVANYNMRGGH